MVRDIAADLGVSRTTALRWAVRMAWDHQHSEQCATAAPPSACAICLHAVTTGLRAPTPSEAPGKGDIINDR